MIDPAGYLVEIYGLRWCARTYFSVSTFPEDGSCFPTKRQNLPRRNDSVSDSEGTIVLELLTKSDHLVNGKDVNLGARGDES